MQFEGTTISASESSNALPRANNETQQNDQIITAFHNFIKNYRNSHDEYIYRDQLHTNYGREEYYLTIDLNDLRVFNENLFTLVTVQPNEIIHLFETALLTVLNIHTNEKQVKFQLLIINYPNYTSIRNLTASHINHLVTVRGIIVSTSKARIKATNVAIMCTNCKLRLTLHTPSGFGSAQLPRRCPGKQQTSGTNKPCPLDSFMICADDCSYINIQTLKLQESPEDVPTGEIPRHVSLLVENYLVGQVKPGTRVTVIGVHATFSPKYASSLEQNIRSVNDIGVRVPYIRVFGIQQDSEANDILLGKLTPNDEEKILQLVSNTPNMYELIAKSMAPAIMGHDDIKKAITCCLFGGCSKVLADGIRLRGDINILLIGDPSVAKSQFLKFAAQVAPISVYTSGKGSSAAGLTAAVIRDASTGDFHLEGGALVLADRGVVCIDEFDKMREQDRVAIHEAMEQQTISIAKAGITTILNSRTSVIAAANPTFGRYDDMKSATDNIDFQATILSRFDLIFIVRDLQDTKKDQVLAEHIINVHRRTDTSIQMYENVLGTDTIRKLIAYARQKNPKLSPNAAKLLRSQYVAFRQDLLQRKRELHKTHQKKTNDNAQIIPITVRQLEAIIRISESLARIELNDEVTEVHVNEALRLFRASTIQAASSSYGNLLGLANNPEFDNVVKGCQDYILKKVPYASSVSTQQLIRNLISNGYDENAAKIAIDKLVHSENLVYESQRKNIRRVDVPTR